MKNEKTNKILIFIIFLISSILLSYYYFAYSAPPISPYQPGETLDPNCSPGDTNCTVSPAITSLNGLTTTTQIFSIGTTGNDFNIFSTGSIHIFNLPDADTFSRGLVSTGVQAFSGDKTFTGNLGISSLTPGSLLFAGTGGVISEDNNSLFWDNTNKRLGIRKIPNESLDVVGNISNLPAISFPPSKIGSLIFDSTETSGYTIALAGRYAYVGVYDSPSKIVVIDVSNPSSPTRVGAVTLNSGENNVQAIAVSGKYVYAVTATNPTRVVVIDVSNPSSPTRVGAVTLNSGESNGFSIAVSGRYAYILNFSAPNSSVVVIDVSDPTSPTRIGGINLTGYAYGIKIVVSGKYAYVVTSTNPTRFIIIDISNPTSPTIAGSLTLPSGYNSGANLDISGRYAYVVTYTSPARLAVIDVANPSSPTLVGGLAFSSGENNAQGIAVAGRYVYIVTFTFPTRLLIADVFNPSSPVKVGSLTLSSGDNGGANIVVSGRYSYLVLNTSPVRFIVVDNNGIESGSMMAHSLEAGDLNVRKNLIVYNDLMIGGGLNVGLNGIFSGGPLSVTGSIVQKNALNCALSSDVNGQIICTISSLKYKENIQDLTFDKDKFLSLQPKTFEFKKDLPFKIEGKQIGFIAEEVATTFNDLVRYNQNNEPEGIKYENISIYLYSIVKDLIKNFASYVKDGFAQLGIIIENGIIKAKELIADILRVKEIKELEKFEMKDKATSEIYCVWLEYGEFRKVKGNCDKTFSSTSSFNKNSSSSDSLNTSIATSTILTTTPSKTLSTLLDNISNNSSTTSSLNYVNKDQENNSVQIQDFQNNSQNKQEANQNQDYSNNELVSSQSSDQESQNNLGNQETNQYQSSENLDN
ncbi:MAG: hypothetical protein KatS3mg094_137 [Candidatus Parcubacteria bacterium]|nr:MAG: hypothetical protein KatS3mg094_137 [Candidatus Parcubacteria bacterium]